MEKTTQTSTSKITKLLCATLEGFEAKSVVVETQLSRGLPSFSIVGLPSAEIKESKDRLRAALSHIEFKFPPSKITVNLSPSDIQKNGTHFDLALALGILLSKKKLLLEDTAILAELGLDGSCKDTNDIFAIVLSLSTRSNIKKFIVPQKSIEKLHHIPDIEFFAVDSLKEAYEAIIDHIEFTKSSSRLDRYDSLSILDKRYYYKKRFELDFKDIKAQERLKRAMVIAAGGFHNILLEGSPGCGKSMAAKRLRYILPPMDRDEILNSAMLQSLNSGEISFEPIRTSRSPHHSSSRASIFGGGSGKNAKIGEVALAHLGMLFFDEFPFFQKGVLESLREPLENQTIDISRVNTKIKYDTDFLFIAALNPCPCGNLLSTKKECRCSDFEIKRYKNRLSEPILDRIDLYIQMDESSSSDRSHTNSSEMFEKVLDIFTMQKNREQNCFNARMSEKQIEKFCILSNEAEAVLEKAVDNYALSHRAINKVLKIGRTIADIEGSQKIEKSHILEALSYRRR